MEAATPAESARTEDPGLSIAKEAAEVVPAESVRRNGNQHLLNVCSLQKKKSLSFLFHLTLLRFCEHPLNTAI